MRYEIHWNIIQWIFANKFGNVGKLLYLCNRNQRDMAHLYKRDQGRYWESEIPDNKIISVRPNNDSSVMVSYMDEDARSKTVICDKISFV